MLTASQIDAQRRVDATRAALDRLAADHQLLLDATGHIRRPRGLPTPERMAAAGEAWAAERADTLQQLAQGLAPLGASPAPAGVDLVRLDTLDAVAAGLDQLERDVIAWVAPSLAPTDTAARRVDTIARLLPKIGSHPDLLGHVRREVRRLHSRVQYALGETDEVRTLAPRCPYCGARSLREIVGRDLVVCVNAGCRCEDDLCGCREETPTRHQWHARAWRDPATITPMEQTA